MTFSLKAEIPAQSIENETRLTLLKHYSAKLPEAEIKLTINPVNTQLKLTRCAEPLDITLPKSLNSRFTVRASCTKPRKWSLFITGKASITAPVLVTTQPITKGTRLSAADITPRTSDITTLYQGYFTKPEQVIGRTAKRHMATGRVLTPVILGASKLVSKGETVIIEVRSGGMSIRSQGIALQGGAEGDQIDVRNSRSGKVVSAIVIARGRVAPIFASGQ